MNRDMSWAAVNASAAPPVAKPNSRLAVRASVLGFAALACGAAFPFKFELFGEIYLLEPLVLMLAFYLLVTRGPGREFSAPVFMSFTVAGLVTFGGYLLSDLIAANEPWQYLKGWGRVVLLMVDCGALMVLVAHGRQNLWWLTLGIAIGGIVSLALDGVPPTKWKIGYGEYLALLVLALAPLAPAWIAGTLVAAFGALCIVLDYRSLGAACLVVAAIVWWRRGHKHRALARNGLLLAILVLAMVATLAALLSSSQKEFLERREQSNIGRYVGLLVAWRAIIDSPLLGYGSWAADRQYARMLRDEAQRLNRIPGSTLEVGQSLLPHSQFLQAWIEGGLFGVGFFTLFGIRLCGAMKWFALHRPIDMITPLALYFLVLGMWNLAASPFLGIARIYIALAVALIAIEAAERKRLRHVGQVLT
jgi:O-Antigen ligase